MMAFGLNEPNPSAIKGFGVWLTFSSLRATQNSSMTAAMVAMHEAIETAQRFGLTALYHLCLWRRENGMGRGVSFSLAEEELRLKD
jgi:hypothetical protein